jgi:hypothetical protein
VQLASKQEQKSVEFPNQLTYRWPIPYLPSHFVAQVETLVTASGKEINGQPHLDLLYIQPFIPAKVEHELYEFLRSELFFYRVKYMIQPFGKETEINTPRFTTVFGTMKPAVSSQNHLRQLKHWIERSLCR